MGCEEPLKITSLVSDANQRHSRISDGSRKIKWRVVQPLQSLQRNDLKMQICYTNVVA